MDVSVSSINLKLCFFKNTQVRKEMKHRNDEDDCRSNTGTSEATEHPKQL